MPTVEEILAYFGTYTPGVDGAVSSFKFEYLTSLGFAAIVIFLGHAIVKRSALLRKFAIPAPVVSGLLFSIVVAILKGSGLIAISFNVSTIQDLCQNIFFMCVGFGFSWKLIRHCSATSFLRNWDSILEKKRANLRSISEPARLRQPPPRSTGAAHARGRAQSIREERRIAAPPVLFALLWVRLLPALYGPFCGPLRPFGGCPWGVTPPARECLPPAPPDTRRRG